MPGILAAGMLLSLAAPSWDWPQWRGPDRDGASKAGGNVRSWPAELIPRWRSQVGDGQSSPVVSGSTVFVFGREEDREVAQALDLRTGKVAWRTAYRAPYRVYPGAASYGSGPKSTPVVHQGRLFTLGIGGILTGFDATDGRLLWREGAEWVPRVAWHTPDVSMYMSSPVLVNGRVLGLSHRKRGQYFALDPATGAIEWKSEAGQGENAAFVLAEGAVLVLQGDGTLLVLSRDGAGFSPIRRYHVAEGATYATPIPTELGLLVKDGTRLSLYAREGPSARSDRPR